MNYNSESIPPSVQIVLSDLLALYAAELEKAYNTIREMEQSNWLFTVIKKRKKKRSKQEVLENKPLDLNPNSSLIICHLVTVRISSAAISLPCNNCHNFCYDKKFWFSFLIEKNK